MQTPGVVEGAGGLSSFPEVSPDERGEKWRVSHHPLIKRMMRVETYRTTNIAEGRSLLFTPLRMPGDGRLGGWGSEDIIREGRVYRVTSPFVTGYDVRL